MDYPCGKFSDCGFNCFGFVMWTNRHTQTDADECFTPATLVGVKGKDAILLCMELRRSDHLPFPGHWACRWIYHWVCDAWPVTRQTYGHLPIQWPVPIYTAHCVWTTCPESLCEAEWLGLPVTSRSQVRCPSHYATPLVDVSNNNNRNNNIIIIIIDWNLNCCCSILPKWQVSISPMPSWSVLCQHLWNLNTHTNNRYCN